MIPADAYAKVAEARWTAPEAVQAALDFEIKLLLADPGNGDPNDLEAAYHKSPYRNERNKLIQDKVFSRFKRQFKNLNVFFKADLPDNGACRFYMRVAESHAELAETPEATVEHNLNLLRPHEEWVRPVKPLDLTNKVSPQSPRAPAQTDQRAGGGPAFHAPQKEPMSKKLATRAAPTKVVPTRNR